MASLACCRRASLLARLPLQTRLEVLDSLLVAEICDNLHGSISARRFPRVPMDPQKLSDCQSSYDRIAEEYTSRIAAELEHKPVDRMLLDEFAARLSRSRSCLRARLRPGPCRAVLTRPRRGHFRH